MIRVQQIDHIALSVRDVDRSIAFYTEHLGLERRFADAWDGPPIMLGAGDTCLALFPAGEEESDVAPSIGMRHLAFRIDRDTFVLAGGELEAKGIATRAVEHENCHSLYFSDPDGHRLELTCYEMD